MRVAIWHQQLLGEDTFLGEVHLSVGALSTSRSHEAWYTLSSHWEEQEEASTSVIGSLRLLVSYHEDLIHSMSMYEPLKQLLLDGLVEEVSDYRSCFYRLLSSVASIFLDSWRFFVQEFTNSSLNILYEVCKDRSTLGACIVKIFLQLGKVGSLDCPAARLASYPEAVKSALLRTLSCLSHCSPAVRRSGTATYRRGSSEHDVRSGSLLLAYGRIFCTFSLFFLLPPVYVSALPVPSFSLFSPKRSQYIVPRE